MAGDDAEEALRTQGYGTPLWTPDEHTVSSARISHYIGWLADRGVTAPGEAGTPAKRYAALWEWSVSRPGEFWDSVWDYFGVLGHRGDGPALVAGEGGAGHNVPGARWFPGATLNYAEHVLRMPGLADGDPVVFGHSQTRP
ncbi:MAG: hypothetical protein J2P26_14215, partial [Nocardiopsaceae bacterium]|nr:hypothetical protein [Nocardiopsaceae bacterium]